VRDSTWFRKRLSLAIPSRISSRSRPARSSRTRPATGFHRILLRLRRWSPPYLESGCERCRYARFRRIPDTSMQRAAVLAVRLALSHGRQTHPNRTGPYRTEDARARNLWCEGTGIIFSFLGQLPEVLPRLAAAGGAMEVSFQRGRQPTAGWLQIGLSQGLNLNPPTGGRAGSTCRRQSLDYVDESDAQHATWQNSCVIKRPCYS
jgi:hypothetical protein